MRISCGEVLFFRTRRWSFCRLQKHPAWIIFQVLGGEEESGLTFFPQERPSFQVYDPLESSLHALDSDSSLLLQLLRGYMGGGSVIWLRHIPTGRPDFPFNWSSWWGNKVKYRVSAMKMQHIFSPLMINSPTLYIKTIKDNGLKSYPSTL